MKMTENAVGLKAIYSQKLTMTRPFISCTIKNVSTMEISSPVTSGTRYKKHANPENARKCLFIHPINGRS